MTADETDDRVIAATRRWIEKAVIGLRLCPFAAAPFARDQIRYQVSAQRSTDGLVQELTQELVRLQAADPQLCETSLLIHPLVLTDRGREALFPGSEGGTYQGRPVEVIPCCVDLDRFTLPDFDTRVAGKSAGGHDFPESLSEAQRRAVLEYLKTR